MRKLLRGASICLGLFLTGCFHIHARHVLQYYGDSDTGVYRIDLAGTMIDSARFSGLLEQLRTFSRPRTGVEGGAVYVQDLSGTASMEHFYDAYKCTDAPQKGYVDCRFNFNVPKELGNLPNWSIEWEVELKPNMRVLASNHVRVRHAEGHDVLLWDFDGNQVSAASVDFTVRVPRA